MPKEYWVIITLTFFIIIELKGSILIKFDINHINVLTCIFISFSLIVPTIISGRIISKTLSKVLFNNISNNHYIFMLLLNELSNINNYNLRDINISNIVLLIYIFFPLLILFIDITDLYYKPNTIITCGETSVKKYDNLYTMFSLDDITFPLDSPFQDLRYNTSLSLTEDQITTKGGRPIPKYTGSGPLDNCIIEYKGERWIRTSKGIFYKESYVKSQFTRSLTHFASPIISFPFRMTSDYLNNEGVKSRLQHFEEDYDAEHRADAFVSTLLPTFFGVNRGYGYNPQAVIWDQDRRHSYKVDFLVDYLGWSVLVSEHKSGSQTADSFFSATKQARNYALCLPDQTACFVMVLRGTWVSFFLYLQDWHSDKGFDLKSRDVEDLIGLQVKEDGICCVPQSNTYHPQMVRYNVGTHSDPSHRIAVTAILSYISCCHNGIDIQDGFSIPRHDFHRDIDLAPAISTISPGLNLRLQLDPFGKFKY